jgi:hypothetical protein
MHSYTKWYIVFRLVCDPRKLFPIVKTVFSTAWIDSVFSESYYTKFLTLCESFHKNLLTWYEYNSQKYNSQKSSELYFCETIHKSLQCYVRQTNPLRLQQRLERPPSPLEVEWDYSLPLKPWLSPINLLERTNLQSILAPKRIYTLKEQSNFKKKCSILNNVWTMSFWDLERIDANDSIIWSWEGRVFI